MRVCVLLPALSLLQTEYTLDQKKRAQGSLRVCRDDSVSTFSESVGSDSVDTQAYPNHVC